MPKKLRDDVLRELADCRYERETKEFEAKTATVEAELFDALADPDFATSLGLPAVLPEHTRRVLKVTMAADRLSAERPDRSKIYQHYGIE